MFSAKRQKWIGVNTAARSKKKGVNVGFKVGMRGRNMGRGKCRCRHADRHNRLEGNVQEVSGRVTWWYTGSQL